MRFRPKDKTVHIEVIISADNLSADVRVTAAPEEGSPDFTVSDMMPAINAAGVIHGIDDDKLKELADNKLFGEAITFATGHAPVEGRDGAITYNFDLEQKKPNLKEDEHGRVNLKELNLIQNVMAGDVLASLTAPQNGISGMNVKGEELLPAETHPVAFAKGKNVSISADGTQLIADIDGHVYWDGNVNVSDVYEVETVDAATGNIRFNGSVAVSGEINDGFEIHAAKDVTIATSVGRVTIVAAGNITIDGGILGQEKAIIRAGGDIRANFVQDIDELEAKGSIIIGEYILNSHLTAIGPIMVKSQTGFIASSTISSESWIFAYDVGIERAVGPTTMIIAQNPEMVKERQDLVSEVFEKIKDFLKLKLSITKLREIRKNAELTDQQKELYNKLLAAIATVRHTLDEKDERISSINTHLSSALGGKIYIENSILEGTKLIFGERELEFRTSKTAKVFAYERGEIAENEFVATSDITAYREGREVKKKHG